MDIEIVEVKSGIEVSVPITGKIIGNAEINAVNSRDLHGWLESGYQYSDWIKSRIEELGAVENVDFTIQKILNGKNWMINYIVTVGIAKQIGVLSEAIGAMVSVVSALQKDTKIKKHSKGVDYDNDRRIR